MTLALTRVGFDQEIESAMRDSDKDQNVVGVLVNEKLPPGGQTPPPVSASLTFEGDGGPPPRQFANPAPLGLCAFALTCFTSSIITVQVGDATTTADPVVAAGFAYGGLVQILVGMW